MFFLSLSALWFLQTNKIDVTKRMQSYEISIEKTNNYRLLTHFRLLQNPQQPIFQPNRQEISVFYTPNGNDIDSVFPLISILPNTYDNRHK